MQYEKQSLQSVVLVIVFRATSNNAQSWCNMRNIPGRRQSIFDLRLSIVLTFSIAAYPVFFLFVFVALRPMSTAMVIAGRSVLFTTLFPGQA